VTITESKWMERSQPEGWRTRRCPYCRFGKDCKYCFGTRRINDFNPLKARGKRRKA